MSDPFIGQIQIWGGNFAPRGWAFCNGALLPIAQNTALFSILGTTYGGDGRTTFGLPNLTERAPMHPGSGPGLAVRGLGDTGGAATVTLNQNQIPAHDHRLGGSGAANNSSTPINSLPGFADEDPLYRNSRDTTMSATALASTGGGSPHNNMQPSLGLSFIIAIVGTFPSRS
jgi:microcystin-dependent protein